MSTEGTHGHHQENVPHHHSRDHRKVVFSRVPIESDIYRKIANEIKHLSGQLGYEVTMSKFLKKTIAENWEAQVSRYKRLDPSMGRSRQ